MKMEVRSNDVECCDKDHPTDSFISVCDCGAPRYMHETINECIRSFDERLREIEKRLGIQRED